VSWQLASFAVLGTVLLGGFAWYERSRPPSQFVALVAALAALAVAGRLALAPVPNVVATTDIVIFSGYALGGAPGFAVGALAGDGGLGALRRLRGAAGSRDRTPCGPA
jgi:energy-coupling factor transport system substrate-specific component